MDETTNENRWKYDAFVNDMKEAASPSLEPWRPNEFFVRLADLPLTTEATKQLEADISALIEAELKTDFEEPDRDDLLNVSVVGLGLNADRTARLTQAIKGLIRNRLAIKNHLDDNKSSEQGDLA